MLIVECFLPWPVLCLLSTLRSTATEDGCLFAAKIPTAFDRIYRIRTIKFILNILFIQSKNKNLGVLGVLAANPHSQEAWAKTPTGKKRETTHIVRCETEIFRVESNC